ncbi:winged helix-turn-helix transcriptional regulator [Microbacterium sp. WCS2018Hpa-9]|uniref:winged helix-turn-helix transcriptional regulator n=1 Tax=Microbacterium sp. WCS2018Hpa-9 TaxID=3073635 RepID=UPI00288B6BEE|nr:winged helix-turn-helix transcriptional regulator [Microbacterium sp. WCS2018Hpa-9]
MVESSGAVPNFEGGPDGWFPPTEYYPVSLGARLIADRWTVLIIREILVGATGFNAIHRGLPALSRTLLSSRLRYLERIEVISRLGATSPGSRSEYRLTQSGLALRPVLEALGVWARDWHLPPTSAGEVNVATLIWQMYQGIVPEVLPLSELTLAFRFPDSRLSSAWIHVGREGSRASVGVPERQPDLTVIVDAGVLNELWWGKRACADAIARGDVGFEGAPDLAASYTGWFRPATLTA